MSVNTQTLFAFNRPLPPPFDTLKSKKVKVSSTYGDGTEATLSPSMIKAVNAFCRCRDGSGEGALGISDGRSVAEYKSSASPDAYNLVVYDPATGSIMAIEYDKNTEVSQIYALTASGRDGSALLFSLMPALADDEEFAENLEEYRTELSLGLHDVVKAGNIMAVLCDNAYRRIKDDACSAHIKLNIDKTGNLTRIPKTQLDAGKYIPQTVVCGEFSIIAQTGPAPVYKPAVLIEHSDFVGQYPINPGRSLNAREKLLVPKLPAWYIIPKEVVSICQHAVKTSEKAMPMRNFLLRGPAGTGKTMGAQAIAAGLGLPYVKYTCSANTEIFDFVGQVFPDTARATTGDAELDKEREQLLSMGGITYANVAALMKLPGLDDMDYDPEGVYEKLTGAKKPDATSQDCMGVVLNTVTDKVRLLSNVKPKDKGPSYTYVETDFIRALKYGYVCEVQEPTVIMQPGVLVGLNSLLEQTGSITLPTGEVIRRHPDAVVIVTTNIAYEGCRGLNQSVTDRMSLAQDIELPSPEVMAQRAMSVTGCEDDVLVGQMVRVVNDMSDFMRKNGIVDGSCGMRSLIDWILSTEITGDPYTSALYTVISKATANEDDRYALISSVLEGQFAPKRRKAV